MHVYKFDYKSKQYTWTFKGRKWWPDIKGFQYQEHDVNVFQTLMWYQKGYWASIRGNKVPTSDY